MIKMDINKTFDLLEDGDFKAYAVRFEEGTQTAYFTGYWVHYTEEDDKVETPAELEIFAVEEVTAENVLDVGWDTFYIFPA